MSELRRFYTDGKPWPDREKESEEINQQVEAFLASGGKITKLGYLVRATNHIQLKRGKKSAQRPTYAKGEEKTRFGDKSL